MNEITYLNFDLMVDRSGKQYTARVVSSPAGQADVDFKLPFSKQQLEEFLSRVGHHRQDTRDESSRQMNAAKALGGNLFNAVFEDAVRGCFHSSLTEAERRGAGLRVRLRLSEVPELANLPWEFLYIPTLNRFLSLSKRTPIVRYLDLPEAIRPCGVKPPLRVLVMISSPTDYPQLDVEREWAKLTEAFDRLITTGLVKLERLDEATLAALQRKLQQNQYHIFHFIGHGDFDEQTQDGVLVMENEDESGCTVRGQHLGTLLHDHSSLRLAILNACEGARSAKCDAFAGAAQSLVQQGLPAVIAMQFAVTDEAAITFAHWFYETLAKRYPVDTALAESRKAIFAQAKGVEWATPVLYMRSPDGRIFDIEPKSNGTQLPKFISDFFEDEPQAGEITAGDYAEPSKKKFVRRRLMAAALVVLILIGAGYAKFFGPLKKKNAAVVSPNIIAVLPFSVSGSDEIAYLREGMVNLLSTNLDGAGGLRAVDPNALLSFVAHREGVDPEQGKLIAGHFGAGLFVLGNILEVGGRLRINAYLYDHSRWLDTVGHAEAEGETGQFFKLVEDLATQLLARRSSGPSENVIRKAAKTTDSFPALKAYLKGETALRAGAFAAAAEAFQHAVEIDTLFALAYYRLSIAEWWLHRFDRAHQAAEKAMRLSASLSERERLLLNAFRAMQRGATLEAERLYRDILAIYPNEVEAWWHLGEVLFHGGPLQGRSLGDSRDAWERVLFFDPNDFFALLHLLRIAAAEEDSVRIDSLTTRVLRLTLESAQILEIRAFRTLAIDNQARKEQILTELRQADDLTVWRTVWNLSVYSSDLQDAEQVAKILTEPSRSAEVQAIGHVALAHLELARGRWKAAKAGLAAAKALHPVSAVEFRALLSAAPFLSLHPTELKVMQTEVAQLNVAALPRSASTGASFASHNDLHNHLKVYLLGLLSSRLGEHGKAQGYAKKLEKLGGRCEAIALTGDLVQSLHAQVAWRKGHPEKALEAIKQRRMEAPYEVLVESPFISQALERYVNAELLTVLERYEEALPWYGSFAQHSIYDLIYLAPAHLRRAQIYERLEQQDKVVEHYTRFIELWQDCDPELKPKVVNAKDRLAQIRPKLM